MNIAGNTPAVKLALVLLVGIGAVTWAVSRALDQPHLEFAYSEGTVIEAGGETMTLEAVDLIPEPGDLLTHAELNRFHERQDKLAQMIAHHPQTRERHLSDLSALFWIPILVGMGALSISGWIWSLRSRDPACLLFALSGIGTFTAAVPSSIYTTRELAIPSGEFVILETLNAWGSILFGIAMVCMFLIYPVRLKYGGLIGAGLSLFLAIWAVAFTFQVTPAFAHLNLGIITAMLLILIAIAAQFFATRRNPTARASLMWLGLSVFIGAGAFVAFISLPALLEINRPSQNFGFLSFLVIYLGLAAGITRYRLFEVGQWAFRFLYFAAGAIFLVLLDAGLIVLGLGRAPALGVSLLLVGFIYLPLRDLLWRRINRRDQTETSQLLDEALHVAFAPSPAEALSRWTALLQKAFDPLKLEMAEGSGEKARIADDGLTLFVPPVLSAPAMQLGYPWGGRALFSPNSRDLTDRLVSLIRQAESSRQAYDRGANEERLRMAQDLHDNVGARLLTSLYLADEKLKPTLQEAIADIRTLVKGMAGKSLDMLHWQADLRHEIGRRLEAAGIALEWKAHEIGEGECALAYRQHNAISTSVREIVSNLIRHSGARLCRIEITLRDSHIELLLTDDGVGINTLVADQSNGHGLKNVRRRLADVGGTFEIRGGAKGTEVYLSAPCNPLPRE